MQSPTEKKKRATRPLPDEEEPQARIEKTASLRRLRYQASWLVSDPTALFRYEIDCSALFDEHRDGSLHGKTDWHTDRFRS
jgi:hypothetical protein